MEEPFVGFPKVHRLFRECIITEKIDGTNAQIVIGEDGSIRAGSKSRFITPQDDNFGFARWVDEHKESLRGLGPGRHVGEWWGSGIQRGYGLPKGERRFSLFNVTRWEGKILPEGVHVVPVLGRGVFCLALIADALLSLENYGSRAVPWFKYPEGIVMYHTQGNVSFKVTLKNDEAKGEQNHGKDSGAE